MLFEIQDILSRTKDVDKKEGALESFTQTTGPAIGHMHNGGDEWLVRILSLVVYDSSSLLLRSLNVTF